MRVRSSEFGVRSSEFGATSLVLDSVGMNGDHLVTMVLVIERVCFGFCRKGAKK